VVVASHSRYGAHDAATRENALTGIL